MSIFNSIQVPKIPRSRFNMSHYNQMTADYGRLYPFLFIDCVPNDTFKLGADVLINTAPMITAPYTQNDVRLDYFFVPYRLLWSDWKDFITGGEDGTAEPVLPNISVRLWHNRFPLSYNVKCLLSYFGVKCFNSDSSFVNNEEPLNSLPLRAYSLIWNEWYRDQNVEEEIDIHFNISGSDSQFLKEFQERSDDYGFLHRRWRKDYFTSALPSPQRGVEVPINFNTNYKIPVEIMSPLTDVGWTKLTRGLRAKMGDDLVAPDEWAPTGSNDIVVGNGSGPYLRINADGELKQVSQTEVSGGGLHVLSLDDVYDVYAPLGEWLANLMSDHPNTMTVNSEDLPAITINDLRRANAIQVWLERNMRAGARYVEQILSHFGVRVPDYRLDRPEYLGGEQFPVQISQIFQNSESTEDSAIGSYGGKGKASVSARIRKYRVEEHGCIIGLMSILPKAVYANGINHYFLQRDKFDFYFPEFANLGEQEIKTKEVAVTSTMVSNYQITDSTFGYTPRYAHMKFIANQVNGDFLTPGMRHFTQYRQMSGEPNLGISFLDVNPSRDGINRIWAVEDGSDVDHFWCTIFNQVHAKRPMPKYGTPKLIG